MKTLTICVAMLFAIAAMAQKIPARQEAGLRAPSTIKIDGKAGDWRNKFEAYNKATNLFYSLANDDENLYLIIKATDEDIVNKMAWGGVTFSFNGADKKDKVTITYPKFNGADAFHIDLKYRGDGLINQKEIDSIVNVKNISLGKSYKQIEVEGLKDIGPVISVYNEEHIKAAARVDDKFGLTFEVAIPLKYLPIAADGEHRLTYNIKVNGAATNHTTMALNSTGTSILVYNEAGKPVAGIPVGGNVAKAMALNYPTDFTGEYKLVK